MEKRELTVKEFQTKWGLFDDWDEINFWFYKIYGKNPILENGEVGDSSGIWFDLSSEGVLPYRVDIVLELLRILSGLDDNGLEELILSESNVYSKDREVAKGFLRDVRSTYRYTLHQKKVSEKWNEGDLNELIADAYRKLLKLRCSMDIKRESFFSYESVKSQIEEELKDERLAEFWKDYSQTRRKSPYF